MATKARTNVPIGALGAKLLVMLIAAAVSMTACAKTMTYKKGVLSSQFTSFEIQEIPKEWKPVKGLRDGELAFWNERLGAALAINATCKEYEDLTLKAMANHLVMGIENRKHHVWTRQVIDGREAMFVVVEGDLDGVHVMVAAYVLIKDYCTFDLIYHAPPETFAEGLPLLHRTAKSFTVLRSGEK